ncbi:hypothetical protein Hanom_Chr07g00662461 [Helianthus anomalus]
MSLSTRCDGEFSELPPKGIYGFISGGRITSFCVRIDFISTGSTRLVDGDASFLGLSFDENGPP